MLEYPNIWVWPKCAEGYTYLPRYSYIDTDLNTFIIYRRSPFPIVWVEGKWYRGYRVFIKVEE